MTPSEIVTALLRMRGVLPDSDIPQESPQSDGIQPDILHMPEPDTDEGEELGDE